MGQQFFSLELLVMQGVQSTHALRTLCDAIAEQENDSAGSQAQDQQ